MSSLFNISPVDGRYCPQTQELTDYFSEFALIKFRIRVEVEYLISLCDLTETGLKSLSSNQRNELRAIWENFSEQDAVKVKEIERVTNHDVKAVEYFVKQKLDEIGINTLKEYVHFGLTSQDVNNTAIPLSLKEAANVIYFPALDSIIESLRLISEEWMQIPMLAHTHGQPASPTKLGKEILVFVERLKNQRKQLIAIPYSAKFGGATGNFNAHIAAFPKIDWVKFANNFVDNSLGLCRSQTTTQIEHYDNFAAWCHAQCRINTILIDLCRDIWSYVSMNYFKQKIKAGEVGSSAMPHKVNPIDFENAEGNLGIANAIFEHFASKLPISRLQRDLSDSTVLRNIGVPIAHSIIALKSIQKGLDKLIVNELEISNDLENNWAVVAEAIQTILRKEGIDNPYEKLKKLSRTNTKLNQTDIAVFIDSLEISEELKLQLKAFSPHNYTGVY